MQKLTLTEANVLDILEQTIDRRKPVSLVALDYNWGPPVSGRFDTDFVQIWAAVKKELMPRAVKLLMCSHWQPEIWRDDLCFRHICDCDEYGVYFIEITYPLTEFVIKVETHDDREFYDNNGGFGLNYRLIPYSGRGTTAVAGDGAIRNFKTITPVQLLWRRRKDG